MLWRQCDDDPEQWIYLERMLPSEILVRESEATLGRWRLPYPVIRRVESRAAPGKVSHAGGILDTRIPPTAALRVRLRNVGRN